MAGPSFRDRFFTPGVARAITSPLGIVLAGAGMAAGVALGWPIVAAVGVGVAAWAGRVAVAIPQKGKPVTAGIDPYTLADPWRSYVLGAQAAKGRFERTAASVRSGPLQERLAGVADRFDDAVAECWRIASRGHDIDNVLRTLDLAQSAAELSQARQLPDTATNQATVQSLEAQLASGQRMYDVSQDAQSRLRLLDARMDELVARAAELSVSSDTDLGGLDTDVDGLVTEMGGLRQAIEETNRPAAGGGQARALGSP